MSVAAPCPAGGNGAWLKLSDAGTLTRKGGERRGPPEEAATRDNRLAEDGDVTTGVWNRGAGGKRAARRERGKRDSDLEKKTKKSVFATKQEQRVTIES